MKLTDKTKNKLYLSLAFFVPAIIVLIFMILEHYHPFGDYSYGISDNFHQYMPFFLDYRRALLSGESLSYNWNVGMGVDYLGLIPYYLASPLNLLSVLFTEEGAITYFVMLMPIRLGLASLFFAIFLWKVFGKLDRSTPFFGCFYGMCAWALAYEWNCMWLDTFALTPLVILGAISLLKERKFALYVVTLFLAVAANYYIGLFVCIFVLLTFVCYQACAWEGWKKFALDIGRFAIYSAIALGMTAFITIPAYTALQSTYSSVNQFPSGFQLNIANQNTWIGLLDAMVNVATNTTGGLVPSFKLGLPNLYCGVGALLLAIIYLSSKHINIKHRLATAGVLLFFVLSFIIRQLDYIWHGFHFTNQIPYRFSFLFSFVILTAGYQMWLKRKTIVYWQMYLSAGIILLLSILTPDNTLDHMAYNIFMILMYLCVFTMLKNGQKAPKGKDNETIKKICNSRRKQRRQAAWIMVFVLCLELILNYHNFESYNSIVSLENVPKGEGNSAAVIEYMKANDDEPFYRAETTHIQTHNDGVLNNYHGISAFTSTANVSVTRYMQALGLAAKDNYNRYWYEETSPVANLFLGLKYMISRDGTALDNQYFEAVYSKEDVVLLKNAAYLPLGFMVKENLKDFEFIKENNPFAFQNKLFATATGMDGLVWNEITNQAIISSKDIDIEAQIPGNSKYTGFDNTETIVYSYEIEETGLFCFGVDFEHNNSFSVYKNTEKLYDANEVLPQVLSAVNVKPGDKIDIIIKATDKTEGSVQVYAAVLNDTVFQEGYEKLNKTTLAITEHENTYIAGSIDCETAGLLYTSIPQNGSWAVFVDGEEVEPILVGDVMIGVQLDTGKHDIQFRYTNGSFILGLVVAIFSLCSFAFVIFLDRFYQRNFADRSNRKT